MRKERRGELVGPWFIRDFARSEGDGVARTLALRGPKHPYTRFMFLHNAYIRLTTYPRLSGCGWWGVWGEPSAMKLQARLCLRPSNHEGDHRYLVLSKEDTAMMTRAVRKRVRFKRPMEELLADAARS